MLLTILNPHFLTRFGRFLLSHTFCSFYLSFTFTCLANKIKVCSVDSVWRNSKIKIVSSNLTRYEFIYAMKITKFKFGVSVLNKWISVFFLHCDHFRQIIRLEILRWVPATWVVDRGFNSTPAFYRCFYLIVC